MPVAFKESMAKSAEDNGPFRGRARSCELASNEDSGAVSPSR